MAVVAGGMSVWLVLAWAAAAAASASAEGATGRPNILLIIVDDLGG
jgi:hypothetical protein